MLEVSPMLKNRSHHGRRLGTALAATVVAFGLMTNVPAHAYTLCAPDGTTCPQSQDDNYTTTFSAVYAPYIVAAPGVLANDNVAVPPGQTGTFVDIANSDTTTFQGATVTWQHYNGLPARGTGGFTYTPDPLAGPFTGDDTLTYQIDDPHGDGDTGLASLNITIVPIIRNDTYATKTNQLLSVDAAHGVLANDVGADSSVNSNDAISAAGGTIDMDDNGGFRYTPPVGFSGVDTFGYTVMDTDWDHTYSATAKIFVDSTPPLVGLSALPAVSLSPSIPVHWTGVDPGANPSGISSYLVQVRQGPWNAPAGGWVTWSTTMSTSATYRGALGETYCFRVYAMDRAGNHSGWSGTRCTAVPLKATALNRSRGWLASSSSAYYGGIAYWTVGHGVKAWRTSVHARSVYLIATKCPGCGTLQARWGSSVIANVSLSSTKTLHRQVILLHTFSGVSVGTLTVTVTSPTYRAVVVEGFAAMNA
jgi:hypothetical protein